MTHARILYKTMDFIQEHTNDTISAVMLKILRPLLSIEQLNFCDVKEQEFTYNTAAMDQFPVGNK